MFTKFCHYLDLIAVIPCFNKTKPTACIIQCLSVNRPYLTFQTLKMKWHRCHNCILSEKCKPIKYRIASRFLLPYHIETTCPMRETQFCKHALSIFYLYRQTKKQVNIAHRIVLMYVQLIFVSVS